MVKISNSVTYLLLTNKQYMLIKLLVVASPQKVVLTQGDAIIFTKFSFLFLRSAWFSWLNLMVFWKQTFQDVTKFNILSSLKVCFILI